MPLQIEIMLGDSGFDWAAWVQAIGSIAAIGAGLLFLYIQAALQRIAEAQKQKARLAQFARLVRATCDEAHGIGVAGIEAGDYNWHWARDDGPGLRGLLAAAQLYDLLELATSDAVLPFARFAAAVERLTAAAAALTHSTYSSRSQTIVLKAPCEARRAVKAAADDVCYYGEKVLVAVGDGTWSPPQDASQRTS